ncbi:MAG: hypothetical protein V8T86_09125 [Victivallis sp.]
MHGRGRYRLRRLRRCGIGVHGAFASGYALFYRKTGGCFRLWRFDRAEAAFLLRESLPLLLAGAAAMFYLRFDQVIVTWMLGDAANGQYAVAVRLVEVLFLVPLVVSDSFFPSLVGTRSTSLLRDHRRTEQLMRFMFDCALAILPPAAVAGYFLIVQLYGAAYREAAWLFVFLLFKILLVYPGLVYGKWYLAEGMTEDFDGGGYLRLLYKRAPGLSDDSVVGGARRGGGCRCDQFFHLSGLSAVFPEGAGRRPAFSASLLPVLPRSTDEGRRG